MASGDDFINILFAPEDDGSNPINDAQKKDKDFYNQWVDKCMSLQSIYLYAISTFIAASAKHSGPPISR
jgi:hypothetical protein